MLKRHKLACIKIVQNGLLIVAVRSNLEACLRQFSLRSEDDLAHITALDRSSRAMKAIQARVMTERHKQGIHFSCHLCMRILTSSV